VDPDPVALGEAVSRWGAEGFADVAQAVESRAWDVVVVAAPDEHHLSIVEAIASHPWKALVLEKPPATGRVEWVGIQRLLEPRIADVVVNFTRRWAPGIVRLADDIHAGQWGDFAFGRGVYGNGLVHNGSHLTDLLTWFLGRLEPESISAIVPDRPRDPSTGFRIRTESDKIVDIAAMDCSAFTIFEVDLFFTKGRVRLCSTGGGSNCLESAPARSTSDT
jgi:predicted dehydrogenase